MSPTWMLAHEEDRKLLELYGGWQRTPTGEIVVCSPSLARATEVHDLFKTRTHAWRKSAEATPLFDKAGNCYGYSQALEPIEIDYSAIEMAIARSYTSYDKETTHRWLPIDYMTDPIKVLAAADIQAAKDREEATIRNNIKQLRLATLYECAGKPVCSNTQIAGILLAAGDGRLQ